jgi:branched-chain amino acid transport system permease protein
LIIGGSGNNRGALLGALVVWTLWSATELLTSQLPPDWAVRATFLRIFLIGLGLQFVLQRYSTGLLPEKPPNANIDDLVAEPRRTQEKAPPAE